MLARRLGLLTLSLVLSLEASIGLASLVSDVERMMSAGWKPSSTALEAAARRYTQLETQSPANADVTYAYAIVQLRNRKYDEAARLLGEAIEARPKDLNLRRARIWLSVLMRNYSAALVDMDALSKNLPAENDDPDAEERSLQQVQFIGRIFGFLEGPAAKQASAKQVDEHRKRILGRLNTTRKSAFAAGYEAVAERYAELDLQRDHAKSTAKADEEEFKERERETLGEQRDAIANEKNELYEKARDVREAVKKEVDRIDEELVPLNVEFAQLESEAQLVRSHIASLQIEINSLLTLADQDEDPDEAFRLQAAAGRLEATLSRDRYRYRQLDSAARRVNVRRSSLDQQRRAAVATGHGDLNRLDRRDRDLTKTKKRIAGEEKRASQPATGSTPRVGSLTTQATAFTSYEEFPFEEERQRLLAQIEASEQ